MKRGGYLKRKRRLRQVSERRAAEHEARAKVVRGAYERDGHRCVVERLKAEWHAAAEVGMQYTAALAMASEVRCGGHLDAHEVVPRSAWPGGHLVLDNVVTICRRHHEWVDAFPVAAHDLGLHKFSWERG